MNIADPIFFTCQVCGIPFVKRARQNHFCSDGCLKLYQREIARFALRYIDQLVIPIRGNIGDSYVIVYERHQGKRVAYLINNKKTINYVYDDEYGYPYLKLVYNIQDAVRVRLYRTYPKNLWVTETGILISRLTKRIVYPSVTKDGYLRYNIHRKNHINPYHKVRVHRAVAEMFVPKIAGKNDINHKDTNKFNNHYTNLEWVTHQENIAHAVEMGLFKIKKFEKVRETKPIKLKLIPLCIAKDQEQTLSEDS